MVLYWAYLTNMGLSPINMAFVCLRASVPSDANGICWYYLASKHQKGRILDLLLVNKFANGICSSKTSLSLSLKAVGSRVAVSLFGWRRRRGSTWVALSLSLSWRGLKTAAWIGMGCVSGSLLWNFKILTSIWTIPKYRLTRTRSNP